MTLLLPETILRNILDVYEDNYASSLATVKSNWTSTEDIDLEDFQTRTITTDPTVMNQQWFLPALALTMGPMTEAEIASTIQVQQMRNLYDMQVVMTYYLKHPDASILSKILLRHVEATLDLMRQYPGFGMKGKDQYVVPRSTRFVPSRTAPVGNALVKGLMITFNFRFMHYGA